MKGIPSDDLRERACEILLAGHDSQTMAVLAGAEKDVHPADLRAMFWQGLAELAVRAPTRREAAETLRRKWARDVVDGKIAAEEGASRIVGLLYDVPELFERGARFGEELGITKLAGLYYSLDDTAAQNPATRPDIEREIVAECACIACV
ncbi:MAG: hypothetical protein ACRENE_32170 [Polyangiaceae bacterium]